MKFPTLVKEDPDTAANILKTWIGQGIMAGISEG